MKILFLTENFPPETNAAATRVYERALYWLKAGHEVTILTCAPNFPHGKLFDGWDNKWRQVEDMDGLRVVRVKTFIAKNEGFLFRTLDFVSYMMTAVFFGLFEKRPDVIVSTSPQFFAAVGGWLLSLLKRRPFVFELGDLWPRSILAVGAMKKGLLISALEWLELFLYRRSACVVALTQTFKQDLIGRGIPAEKIAVVINGVDLPRYQPQDRDGALAKEWGLEDKFVIGYVGTHGMAHNMMNVVDAAALIKDQPRFRFMLVGAGAERAMVEEAVKDRGLSDVVTLIPNQPKAMMPKIWSLCDVALVHLKNDPVFSEVIPSKIFEAMGMGLPILCVAPEGEASRIIINDKAGHWVEAGDPKALAEAALRMMTETEETKRLAEQSHAAAPSHSRERQAALMIEALELAASGKGHEAGRVES